ncbi:amidase [bacterium]|nr:MAG: amidase [bacterium]
MNTSAFIPTGLLASSIGEITALVKTRRITARRVLEMHIDRISEVNSDVNAIVTLRTDEALIEADAIDSRIKQGLDCGPLAGIPFTVKDIIATKGLRSTAGSKLLANYEPGLEAPAVARLRAAGAVLLGKSNCPEFALDMHTDNEVFGETHNPWNSKRTSGGSSGGDSAAVSSGCSVFGIGTDYGGSIRWPAHCTALVGLRASNGLIPGTGQIPWTSASLLDRFQERTWLQPPNSMSLQSQLQKIAPIARYVTDVWTLLDVMRGPHPHDPSTVPVELGKPDNVGLRATRVAWCRGDGNIPVRTDILHALESVAISLSRMGLEVFEFLPEPIKYAERVFDDFRKADGLPDHEAIIGGKVDDIGANLREWLDSVEENCSVSRFRELAAESDALRALMLDCFRDFDVLLLPVASIPAFERNQPMMNVDDVSVPRFNILNCCRAISVLNLPSLTVPAGTSRDGLPIGIQIVSAPYREHLSVAVALAIEQSGSPWARLANERNGSYPVE